jgi:hypothetical protein
MVGAFRKSPRKRDLNNKTSSFSIRQLKNYTGFSLQQYTTNMSNNHHRKSIKYAYTGEEALECAAKLTYG